MNTAPAGTRPPISTREILQLRAKDFRTAVYIGVDDGTCYLVGTDHLCPGCTTPMIILDSSPQARGAGALHADPDADCVVARTLVRPTVIESDPRRVADTRRRYLNEALEVSALRFGAQRTGSQ